MEKAKTDELFDEMKTFLSGSAMTSGTNDPDDDGLPFESLDDFSTDPVGFAEMAEKMLQKVENLFDLTAMYNRHSAKYLRACVLLERGIKYLGSACLTKIALELNKSSFPELSQLTTMKLYRMASFNYRKLDAALTEKLEKGNDLYPELLDMVFRYFSLLRRLRSTEKKIYRYHMNKYYVKEDFSPVVEGNAFAANSWTKRYTQNREEAPVFRQAPAFPMIKSEELNKKSENGNQKRGRRASDTGQGQEHARKSEITGQDICKAGDKTESGPDLSLPDSGADSSALSIPTPDNTAPLTPEGADFSRLLLADKKLFELYREHFLRRSGDFYPDIRIFGNYQKNDKDDNDCLNYDDT